MKNEAGDHNFLTPCRSGDQNRGGHEIRVWRGRAERWSRIFAQSVKWNSCLTAGKDSARESGETNEEESTPEPLTGLQGEGRSYTRSAIGAVCRFTLIRSRIGRTNLSSLPLKCSSVERAGRHPLRRWTSRRCMRKSAS